MPTHASANPPEKVEARESEARSYFDGRALPRDKPDFLTRQAWGMLVAHVQGGKSYEAVGEQFETSGDRARAVIADALERFEAQ